MRTRARDRQTDRKTEAEIERQRDREREREKEKETSESEMAPSSTMERTVVWSNPANMAQIRQSRPYSGLGVQVKVLKPFKWFPLCSEAEPRSQRGLSVRAIFDDGADGGVVSPLHSQSTRRRPPPIEEGTTKQKLMTCTKTPRPESSLDYLICATFVGLREAWRRGTSESERAPSSTMERTAAWSRPCTNAARSTPAVRGGGGRFATCTLQRGEPTPRERRGGGGVLR